MKDQRTEATVRDANLAVAVNAIELVSQVVLNVAGNDIANTIEGKLITPSALGEAVAARLQANLAAK